MTQTNFDPENMLKGRMAETLVEDLLKQSGNSVYRFGYEAILQNLTQIQQNFDRYSDAGERIRAIPDFIVVDYVGKPIFLEVKFRWDGKPHREDVERFKKIETFWNARMILVNCVEKPYFRIIDPPYLDVSTTLFNWKPLCDDSVWSIDKNVYAHFESLVEKYLVQSFIPDTQNNS